MAQREARGRPHQSLGYKTPDALYASGEGGGALIVDKFGGAILLRVKKWMQLKFGRKLS